MPIRARFLAGAVAVIWGVNFVAIHVSLEPFPPLALAAFRFTLLAVPTLLLVPRPAVRWRWIIGYGTGFGVAQFAFLYLAMGAGMPAGVASLVLQASAPLTVLLGSVLLRERLAWWQVAGVAVAAAGLGGIALRQAGPGDSAGPVPVVLVLLAALGWASGNICARKASSAEPFRLMMWMTVVPPLPLFALSLLTEGPHRIAAAIAAIPAPTGLLAVAGLAYTVIVATVGGSGIWTALLSRHSSSVVAPYSMLVPVAGIAASWLLLGERPSLAELGFGAVAVGGVLLASRSVPAAGHRGGYATSNPEVTGNTAG